LRQGALGLPIGVHDDHGAEVDRFGNRFGDPVHVRAFLVRGEAVGETHLRIATEDRGAFAAQPLLDRLPHAAHGCDGGNAKR
jgi:hypothetical protein